MKIIKFMIRFCLKLLIFAVSITFTLLEFVFKFALMFVSIASIPPERRRY